MPQLLAMVSGVCTSSRVALPVWEAFGASSISFLNCPNPRLMKRCASRSRGSVMGAFFSR